jgi:DNA-binding NtrC family response regulator
MRQFIGRAPAFLKTIEKVPRVANCDAPVLIIGETGTGKEMCARAIHYLSPRAQKPFIPINCGSIPADLFENEMFGHEAGAYTDARRSQRGMIAEAEGGTLFLDEVDSLPLSAQVKLLRFLQDRQYRPLGAAHYRQANTRLVAASNQNLQNKVREGTFREDLYYRLKVVSLELPVLSARHEDILPLALHFLETSALEYNRPVTRFSNDAVQKLLSYAWPGNVRELENVIRQAVVMADGPVLRAEDFHLSSGAQTPAACVREPLKVAKARMIETFERNYLTEIIAACGGNISRAAREAQKDRRTFFALMQKYGLTSGAQDEFQELNFDEVAGAPLTIGASAIM